MKLAVVLLVFWSLSLSVQGVPLISVRESGIKIIKEFPGYLLLLNRRYLGAVELVEIDKFLALVDADDLKAEIAQQKEHGSTNQKEVDSVMEMVKQLEKVSNTSIKTIKEKGDKLVSQK